MSDKDLFKQYTRIYKAYMRLLEASKRAYRKLVRLQQEVDSTKEQNALLDALKENSDEKPTETEDGSDS